MVPTRIAQPLPMARTVLAGLQRVLAALKSLSQPPASSCYQRYLARQIYIPIHHLTLLHRIFFLSFRQTPDQVWGRRRNPAHSSLFNMSGFSAPTSPPGKLYHNSSSRPSPVERGASRDPGFLGYILITRFSNLWQFNLHPRTESGIGCSGRKS
jgi:hypothetical protein